MINIFNCRIMFNEKRFIYGAMSSAESFVPPSPEEIQENESMQSSESLAQELETPSLSDYLAEQGNDVQEAYREFTARPENEQRNIITKLDRIDGALIDSVNYTQGDEGLALWENTDDQVRIVQLMAAQSRFNRIDPANTGLQKDIDHITIDGDLGAATLMALEYIRDVDLESFGRLKAFSQDNIMSPDQYSSLEEFNQANSEIATQLEDGSYERRPSFYETTPGAGYGDNVNSVTDVTYDAMAEVYEEPVDSSSGEVVASTSNVTNSDENIIPNDTVQAMRDTEIEEQDAPHTLHLGGNIAGQTGG